MAVVVEDTDNTGMQFALMGIGAYREVKLPEVGLDLPKGLEGFWVVHRDFEVALGYLRTTGWMRYESETP
jgi:hypothetical protein